MEQSGFPAEDFASDPVEIFPDNVQVYELFNMMGTQWRVGMNGPTGLDYNVAFHKMDRMALSPDDYQVMEIDLRVMENEAMRVMRQQS
ncbi:DUF1799 domain-containing protein [Janthinobacterium fluminis]|uniref:DUF1799 domain-containing protein n=1 Tax=Janthinobacterium fluminis TaxID=2987524 RepID=A0ABT5JU36_9BURK|nr:DUF1799 domain-containing protein [Janthinobacterium fluminis]MDC8756263.1 DUF1799 domain-containing protein [Janthinobacterium fluminis]